jgi:hypothetical protein
MLCFAARAALQYHGRPRAGPAGTRCGNYLEKQRLR